MSAEFGEPQWIFGMSRYAFLSGNRVACVYSQNGVDHLGILDIVRHSFETLSLPYSSYSELHSDGDNTVFAVAGSPVTSSQVLAIDLRNSSVRVLKSGMETQLDRADVSVPEPIEFPTTRGLSAHALFYRPANKNFSAPADERPPLLVLSHGGPTASASSSLKLSIQYWTSRGFAVVDVNYGGSSGYGREYRERLNGQWGIVDVDDCIHAALYLADRGDVDRKRMAIRGGSAGGYTTLCALVFHNVFAAGASHFGVGDLEALAHDTHKFESRYLDRLVAPYPAGKTLYHDRSPIHFADRLSCPVILFQGLDDKVVPPNQAETFAAALRSKGLPFAYVTFAGEGHGFRKAESIRRAAEAELYFYSRVFGFTPADPIEPVHIEGFAH
jgi:dipeptidyl aminopeptidase/acylaminoacyl peptidase